MVQISPRQQRLLLSLARSAIAARLGRGELLAKPEEAGVWDQPLACFVTLHQGEELRGCVGTLAPHYPLWQAVEKMAVAAAFEDGRFPPLSPSELDHTAIAISVLTPPEPIEARGEDELLAQLHPGLDGLTLDYGRHHATFLPAVWDTVSDPKAFVAHLKVKAGLSAHTWSDEMRWSRYGTLAFGEDPG
ncbi:AmmeMemoRadiSam system protein A [Ferrimonas sediminicola]|uniref:AmmeMemoRadiSam system protein A n=1 Tax=Ferrimonas sediminicola TaxID=2569538 RepID=A0A4V6WMN2_9GAMM|nr:AmmeMemoRadiSam system protein A [Ferrimonas sediminicola]TKB48563.1 AmmeMemoRadiSam system protein A [Ferrimonas sediminicola]